MARSKKTKKPSLLTHVGCSGWYYAHWKERFYPADLPKQKWFAFYQEHFSTVELNAPFYRWPSTETVRRWIREARSGFVYSVKVNQLITHRKRFHETESLVQDFYRLLEPMGEKLGCVLFQLPPSFHYSPERLETILRQLNPSFQNVLEFRHISWWQEEVYNRLKEKGVIFCVVSAPNLPDTIVCTTKTLYIRFHGPGEWYRHEYTQEQLQEWAARILKSGCQEAWIYFNNDWNAAATRNAQFLAQLLQAP